MSVHIDATEYDLPASEFEAQKITLFNLIFNALDAGWTTWTPTWVNLTVGNGTVVAKYRQIGKLVVCRLSLVLGSTSSVSGDFSFTLPVTSISYPGTATTQSIGTCQALDAGVSAYLGQVVWASTTTAKLRFGGASGTYVISLAPSGSVPFSWGNTDELFTEFVYEAA